MLGFTVLFMNSEAFLHQYYKLPTCLLSIIFIPQKGNLQSDLVLITILYFLKIWYLNISYVNKANQNRPSLHIHRFY